MIYTHKDIHLEIECSADCITRITFLKEAKPETQPITALDKKLKEQLDGYFNGTRTSFDLPLCPRGTDFQEAVWQALTAIPYGETRTYAQIAAQIGKPKACRAVGMANHHNPLPILIPCHRVIGANGRLTGYAGGLEIKKFLLDLEQKA